MVVTVEDKLRQKVEKLKVELEAVKKLTQGFDEHSAGYVEGKQAALESTIEELEEILA